MGSSSAPQTQTTTGGSSSNSTSTSTNTPFQQEYFAEGLGQAKNLYEQGLPQYYQGQTVSRVYPCSDGEHEPLLQLHDWRSV